MTNTELVRQLKTASVQADDMRLRDFGYLMKTAAEKIDELLDSVETLDNLTDMLMECVPQWISVNERLPEDSKQKIVFHSRGVSFAYYSRTGWFSSIGKSHYLQTVTHWMPLPNPPEKGREE